MQSRERTRRKKKARNGLAVPIALLALFILGVLVTGMFYSLSRAPDRGGPDGVHVGQASAPEAGMELQERHDSIVADSLTVPADTVAVGAAASAPFSTNPAASPPALHNSAAETLPTPASRDPGFAGAHRSDPLHDR